MKSARIDWSAVLDEAASILASYDTGVTLRQMFYRLVAAQVLPNTQSVYKRLSATTADARRDGDFPPLIDRGRRIHEPAHWDSPADAFNALVRQYRLDRTDGQDFSIYLAVEKAGLVMQLEAWFGELGIPIIAVSGYSSQTYVDNVAADVERQERSAVLLYAGDFDPSGEDIDRDFVERTDCWVRVVRVALNAEQVEHYDLPPQMGKATDSRSSQFLKRHGRLIQVELDALPPDVLQSLYQDAIDEFWDVSRFEAVLNREVADIERLRRVARTLG